MVEKCEDSTCRFSGVGTRDPGLNQNLTVILHKELPMDPFASNASDDEGAHDYSYSPAESADPTAINDSTVSSFPAMASQSVAGRVQGEISIVDSVKISDGLGGQYVAYTIQIGVNVHIHIDFLENSFHLIIE